MDSDETVHKKRKRSRKTQSEGSSFFSSSISARLHPDFDPAENVTQAFFAENHVEEINPKTAAFEILVELLHPTFIFEYFEKILQFLNSRQKEICFPMIAPFKEAFLVRIAKNNCYLRSPALDGKNRQLGSEILQFLEKNRNVFKWVYTYEDGIVNKNVLVYKKQFPSEAQNDQKKILGSKQPSASSLASNLEDMSLSNERQENVASSFKTKFLNTTLKFINDDTNQLILEYPEMSLVEGQYIYSLIYNRNNTGALGFGFRSMYSTLHDAIKKLEDNFDLKVSFKETCNVNTIRIVIEKARKLVNGTANKKCTDLNSSTVSTSSVDSKKLPDIIKQLSDSFIKPTLEKAAKFFEDDGMVSLDFKKLSDAHAKLVTSLPKMCRQEHLFDLFSSECRKILKRIKSALKSDAWNLQINVGKTCKKTSTRTITYSKEPVFNGKEKLVRSVVVRKETTPVQTKLKGKDHVMNDTPTGKVCVDKDSKTEKERNLENLYLKAVNSNSKGKKTNKYIEFQSAGLQSVDTARARVAPGDADVSTAADMSNRLSAKRKKIMEALSTPLESDRAERMMRNMGWDGGALGVRGDGITEPILPALHIKPGAGLGHVKPLQEQQASQFRSPADFRISFLKTVFRFIDGSEEKATVSYKHTLTRKERRFVSPTLTAFNDRKQIGLNSGEEMDLVAKISKKMLSDPTLQIDYQLGDDCKQLKLAKEFCRGNFYTNGTRKKKNKSKSSAFTNDVKNYISHVKDELCDVNKESKYVDDVKTAVHAVSTKIATITLLELAGELEDYCASLKMAKSIAFRVLFLEKLRRFIADKSDVLEITFDTPINQKHKGYIEAVVSEINKRKWVKKASGIEDDVYKEIRKSVGDCYLCTTLGVQKIVLKKKFYHKRFTNSALEPPKSQDIRNTIIYKDNIAYRPEELDQMKVKSDENDTKSSNDQDENDSDADILDINDSSNVNFDSDDTMSNDRTENCNVDSKDQISLDISSDSLMLDIVHLTNTGGDDTEETQAKLEVNNNHDGDNKNSGEDLSRTCRRFLSGSEIEDSNGSSKTYSSVSCVQKTDESKYVKHIVIVPKCGGVIDVQNVRLVQKFISDSINEDVFLPSLECNGIQNGGLMYSCHSEKTFDWLKDTISVASDVKVIDTEFEEKPFKVNMKINSFIPESVKDIFRRLELYNPGLSTNSWTLLKEEIGDSSIVFTLSLDENSVKFICGRNFSLFMGVDAAKFSVAWD